MNDFSPPVTGIGGIVLSIVLMIWPIASGYRVTRSNEVYIIAGQKDKAVINPKTGLVSTDPSGQKIVVGDGVFVIPLIQRLRVLDLFSRRIMIQVRNAVSRQGIKLSLDGVAIVKVGGSKDSTRTATQCFLTQQEETETFAQGTLTDVLRSTVGGLSMEQIICDCAAFTQRVADEFEASLIGQGLVLDIFQIQDITDNGTYLSDLRRPESAKVGQIVAIAEVNARREAEQTKLVTEQEIVVSERELAPKKAEIRAGTDAACVQAAIAGSLAQADRDQVILTEQEKVAVCQVALKDRQLDTEARKPTDTKRYETETAAQRRRNFGIFETEAHEAVTTADAEIQAETARLTGKGGKQRRAALAETEAIEGARRGEAEKAHRIAEADAACVKGEAKAATALVVGTVETKAMDKRTAAFVNYNKAAILQILIEALPQIAEGVAAPAGSIGKFTIVSMEGAAALPRQVNDNMLQTAEMIKNTTGIDLFDTLERYTNGKVLRGGTVE